MAFLKFGSSNINEVKSTESDFIILSQIVDSQSSYEYPRKITSVDSLVKWFGDNYTGYDYHCELLKNGATLYLYKPISKDRRTTTGSYINYSDFEIISDTVYDSPDDIPLPIDRQIFTVTSELYKEYVYHNGEFIKKTSLYNDYPDSEETYEYLEDIEIPTINYRESILLVLVENTLEYYIWSDDYMGYINVDNLPQNMIDPSFSSSWDNRDTLSLTAPGTSIQVGHPRYNERSDIKSELQESIDTSKVLLSYDETLIETKQTYTYAFDLDLSEVSEYPEGSYICLYTGVDKIRHLIYFNEDDSNLPSEDYVSLENRHYVDPSDTNFNTNFWNQIRSLGLNKIGDHTLWSSCKMPIDYFYKLDGLSMEPNYRISWDIIELASNKPRITFISKTLGKNNHDLQIKIEKISLNDEYQVTISRNGYGEEVFVGDLFPDYTNGSSFLGYVINNESELVKVKIDQYDSDGKRYKNYNALGYISDPTESTSSDDTIYYCTSDYQYYKYGELLSNPDIPSGTWTLKGSEEEEYTTEEYTESLSILGSNGVEEDFLMIPDFTVFRSSDTDLTDISWYPEYENILEYCESKNCQALISNNDIGIEVQSLPDYPKENVIYLYNSKYYLYNSSLKKFEEVTDRESCNPYLNEFIWNYITTTDDLKNPQDLDPDNYLIYFYRNMLVNESLRPAYYMFLNNILSDTHEMSNDYLIYGTPVSSPYIEEDIETSLIHKKSNYMVTDGSRYFYKKYINDPGTGIYNTSIMTKFFQSKLTRYINNNKWDILGRDSVSSMIEGVNSILSYMGSRFSLIYSIVLTNYNIDYENNIAEFYITIRSKELVEKDINLNITLNYIS